MAKSSSTVYRLPAVALILPFVLFCLSAATIAVGGWWLLTLAVPAVGLWWFVRTSTVVDPQGVTARRMIRRHRLSWSDIRRLELDGTRWVVAIGPGTERTRLPMVLPTDLPELQSISGGKLHVGAA